MTKEELIGRKFEVKDGTQYLIEESNQKDRLWLWKLPHKSAGERGCWKDSEVLTHIKDGTWKLLPEEQKIYKTPKGIEYGVGTQFNVPDAYDAGTCIYTIKSIDKQDITINWNTRSSRDVKHKIADIERYFDTDYWHITTQMKDYKQVDPKTIKFDFTNTKIKVNNEDESKWIQEVAFNNNCGWDIDKKKVSFTDKKVLCIFPDKAITWADSINGLSEFKEITIQDILNNMKEVIEVGDVVEIVGDTYGLGEQVEVINIQSNGNFDIKHINKKKLTYSNDYETTTGYEPNMLKLVSKGKKKEVVGYETVVDLPGIPKGSRTQPSISMDYKFGSDASGATLYFTKDKLQDTKFFKPIYKQDAIELKFSKYTATLSKEHGLVFSDGEKLNFSELTKVIKQVTKSVVEVGKYGDYKVSVDIDIKSVQVGCKSFTSDDVKLVSDAIKKLDE